MSKPVNIVLEKYDNEELAEANELIGDLLINANIENKRLKAENAKLREYAESFAKAVEGEGCGWCPYDIDAVCDTETMPMRDGCKLYDELHELGMEVE